VTRLPGPGPSVSSGPFQTEAQARSIPAVREAYDAAHERRGELARHNHRMLCTALTGAGVDVGEYDHRIIIWLAGWEPQMCAVLAGLITRASKAGAS
jgi:hypothetical protein